MSLFDDDIDEITDAIAHFNSLSDQEKVTIVANFFKMPYPSPKLERLYPLLTAISNDIGQRDETTISNRIFELGMAETYAVLFVKNTINNIPTLEYMLGVISKINDDSFTTNFPEIFKSMWIERMRVDEILEKFNLTKQQLDSILGSTRNLMSDYLRSNLSDLKIKDVCKKSGMSDSKVDTVLNTVKIYSEFWNRMLVFSNTQDTFFKSNEIKQQNIQILNILKEILVLLREMKEKK